MHRLLPTTSSCFSFQHASCTRPCWPLYPSSRAYLSLHSSEAPQGIDLSRSLFTCTNTNQAATYTYNTRPRVSPYHVVHHSSQPERPSTGPLMFRSSIEGFVRLQIQMNFYMTINRQQAPFCGVVAGEQAIKIRSSITFL
jgi:hypothetical protein